MRLKHTEVCARILRSRMLKKYLGFLKGAWIAPLVRSTVGDVTAAGAGPQSGISRTISSPGQQPPATSWRHHLTGHLTAHLTLWKHLPLTISPFWKLLHSKLPPHCSGNIQPHCSPHPSGNISTLPVTTSLFWKHLNLIRKNFTSHLTLLEISPPPPYHLTVLF